MKKEKRESDVGEGRMIIPSTLAQLIWYQSHTRMSLPSASSFLPWWPCSPLLVHPSLPSLFVEGKQRRGEGEKEGGGHTLISQSLCKLSQESFLPGCQGLLAPGEVPLHLLLSLSSILVIHLAILHNGQQLLLKLVDALHHSLEVFSLLHCVQLKWKYLRFIFWSCQIKISLVVEVRRVNVVQRCNVMNVEDVLFN